MRITSIQHFLCFCVAMIALSSGVFSQWSQIPGQGTHWCLAVYATNDAIVVATQDSNIMRSTDQGGTWLHSSEGIEDSLYTYTLYGDGHDVYLGSNKGGYVSTDEGRSWRKIDAGSSGSRSIFAFFRSGSYLFMGGDSGVFRSTDGGQNWQRMTDGLPSPVTIRSFGSNDRYLYAGTRQQALYRSSDNGEHWERSGTGMNDRATPSSLWIDSAYIVVMYEGATYFRSTDYGDTWTYELGGFGSSAALVYCAKNVDGVLLIGTDIGVVRSPDKGITWRDVSSGIAGGSRINSLSAANGYLYAGSQHLWIWRRPLSEILPPAGVPSVIFSSGLYLHPNLPNPIKSTANISYVLSVPGTVSLKLYDAMAHEVRTLVSKRQEAGEHSVTLDASDLSSGVYYYRLSVGASSVTRQLIVTR